MVAVPSIGRAAQPAPQHGAPEADATRRLYEQYARQIYAYCFHQLRSKEEAEDATQSTFLNAFRGLQRGIDPEFESAWLYKIAQNVCLTRQRSSTRRRRIESPGDLDAIQDVLPAREVDSDDLIGLPEALEGMPEQQRRALLLREWQGLSYKEIADELGLSQSAVETLLFRARRTLANGLDEEREGGLVRRIQTGGDAGALLALVKSLVVTGGAWGAPRAAPAAPTSVVAATPAARHAVADAVAFEPTPKPVATHPVSAPATHAAATRAIVVAAPASFAVHAPAASTPAAVPVRPRHHATVKHPSTAAAVHSVAQPLPKPDPSDPVTPPPAAVEPPVSADPPAVPSVPAPVTPALTPPQPSDTAPASQGKDKSGGGHGHDAPTAAPTPAAPTPAPAPTVSTPAPDAQQSTSNGNRHGNGNGGGKDHGKRDSGQPAPAPLPPSMSAAPNVPVAPPAPQPTVTQPAAPGNVVKDNGNGKDHGNGRDKGQGAPPVPAPAPAVTVAAPPSAPSTTTTATTTTPPAPAPDASTSSSTDSSHGNGKDKTDHGTGHGKKG